MKLGVGSGTGQVSRIENLVARRISGHVRADFYDDAGGVPTMDLVVSGLGFRPHADLRVDGIDRNGADFHEEVPPLRGRAWQVDID
jgi:hypothetical protein